MSLLDTLMLPIRTEYQGSLDKNEARSSVVGAFEFMYKDGFRADSIIQPSVRQAIESTAAFDNTVQTPVINANNISITNIRSCNIPIDDNTSSLVNYTLATYVFTIAMYPAQYTNNNISYEDDFARKLRERSIALAKVFDTQSISALESNKNVYWPSTMTDFYGQVGDAFQIPLSAQQDYYNNLRAIKMTQDFEDEVSIISNPMGAVLRDFLDNQGANNGTNLSFQMPGYDWYWTNRIANNAGVRSTQYAVTEGNTAVVTRVDPDARMGHRINDGKFWEVQNVPLLGSGVSIDMGVYYDSDCADASGLQTPNGGVAGKTRTKVEKWEFSVDAGFFTAYNSDTANTFSPITKVELLNA